ncbi:tail tube protein [Fusobacterium naviforme]|nr:hypothetical protein F7P78_06265 [Fusobacterium naviforme]PSL10192.1 tail tube protein [Fusobacterium naviforme]STO27602.1 Protein of uncharacterised function (DUF2001) [Fusobacterium naviforme]
MALMEYNKNPISLREGKVFIDGVEVLDSVNCTIKFTPDVWTGKQLGERSPSSRWLGYTITGTITRRRSTNWLESKIKQYLKDGGTPELKIQGVMNDENSDYYAKYGSNVVTCVGVVLTGDLPLTALDSGGEVVDDSINFNAKALV